MAGLGYKYLAFLVAVHTLLYGAMAADHIPSQEDDNPHKQFVEQVRGNNLTETARVEDDSNIIDGTFGPAVKSLGFLNTIAGILSSPYTVVANSGLPSILVLLVQGLIGLTEGVILAQFLRGASF